ncbi:MAG: hypothetical protein NVS9B6_02030 [Candidatus Limnocylindrales bacterium]
MIFARATALAVLFSVLFPLVALAHPLGNFTVNRYSRIEIGPDRITLRYVIDLAEIPTLQELQSAGVTTVPDPLQRDEMLRKFVAAVRDGTHLTLAGNPVALTQRDATLELLPGQAGLSTMRLTFDLSADVRVTDNAPVAYRDTVFADRIGWREIVVRAARGVRLEGSTVPSEDQTNELRSYPTDPSKPPLSVSSASAVIRLAPGEGGATAGSPGAGTPRLNVDGFASGVSDLIRAGAEGDLLATVLAVLAAVGLGAFHAVTPGHGKTVMAAYLVGTRGSARQALGLGAAVAVSHTIGVLLLSLFILGASSVIAPDRFYPYLSAVSALIILGIGLWLLRGVLLSRAHAPAHDHSHDHGHDQAHGHSHGPGGHDHLPTSVGWRGLIALGISGGIVPSASALLLLLAAVSLRRPDLGLILIVAFGIGMAVVLVGIGLVLVRAGKFADRHLGDGALIRRLSPLLPIGTTIVVLLIGIGLTVQAGQQLLAAL